MGLEADVEDKLEDNAVSDGDAVPEVSSTSVMGVSGCISMISSNRCRLRVGHRPDTAAPCRCENKTGGCAESTVNANVVGTKGSRNFSLIMKHDTGRRGTPIRGDRPIATAVMPASFSNGVSKFDTSLGRVVVSRMHGLGGRGAAHCA